MNNTEKRKDYMRKIYSKQWSRKRAEYGIEQYDRDLISEISSSLKKERGGGKILEVAIGDGFPYANEFDKMGYDIYGIDIAPTHVEMVNKALPNVNVSVGDSENLQFSDNFFNIVFCFRSTWYFTNLIKSISEMIRVVKNDGIVFFDIQNSYHPIHRKLIREQNRRTDHYLYHITSKYIRNFIKLLVRPIKYYPLDWSLRKNIIIDTPTDPSIVNHLLQKENFKYKVYGVNWRQSFTLKEIKKTDELNQFDRLVYKIKKRVNQSNI